MTTRYFVDELPETPAPLTQTVVPVGKAKLSSYGWQPVMENGEFVGFRNPKLGQFIHSAVVDGEKALYDIILWQDGQNLHNGELIQRNYYERHQWHRKINLTDGHRGFFGTHPEKFQELRSYPDPDVCGRDRY